MRNNFGFILPIFLLLNVCAVARLMAQTTACGVTVNAGPDQLICDPGETVMLNGSITGDVLSAAWSSGAVANPANLATTAVVNATTTYVLRARSVNPQNLVFNGDFSLGNTGFTTDYEFNNTDVRPEGRYAVVSNGRIPHNSFANCGDHTGGGLMMVVNASGQPNNVWCQTITIQPNTEYVFSAWAASMVSQNPARLQVSINGTLIGTVFQAPAQTCQWREFIANWTSDTIAATALICIANVNNTPAGNDFALDDISFREICELSDSLTVQVANLNANWNAPAGFCQNDAALELNTLLDSLATPGGTWTINGAQATVFNPGQLVPGDYELRYTVQMDNCERTNAQTIRLSQPANAGIAQLPPRICERESDVVNLGSLLAGADSGGSWSDVSSLPATGGAFNAAAGTFSTAGQAAGVYSFTYRVGSPAPCPDAEATVNVVIEPAPVADAGPDLELNCAIDMVTIGGPSTTTGSNIQYQWSAAGGSPILLPNIALTEVEAPDTYTLVVTNPDNGCSSSDAVTVVSRITAPLPELNIRQLTCNSTNDGSIVVTAVSNGEAPFEYAINDGAFSPKNEFPFLSPGNYTITVRDRNGCENSVSAVLAQPEALAVALLAEGQSDRPLINQGDSLRLRIITSKPENAITSVVWFPDTIGCATCLRATDRPMFATTYLVRVTDENGCIATADLTVFVQETQRVFLPTAFSPNGDGINDLFYVSAAQEIQRVKAFRVMNRWGVMVFNRENFAPNDPTLGWDGRFNGAALPNGVYVYVAELESATGQTIVISGDVTLLQ
ncbi:MAG TPA: gliding motility-associated C-terminal domain-containing protein [Saprospiraceae bacterium]|nr:gliding motility-associated C-terminal domain-containing protein [Saprospiraceae bacterium]HMP24472.1 gliding motility-associated C-terminal domain-containing protein [Saprospiraceae bacterium]